MKRIAILGTGKTGGEILRITQARPDFEVIAINRANPPTAALWKTIDAAICFLPGPAFLEYLDLFLNNPKPMIIGSTGFELSAAQNERLKNLPCPWVMSSNFSLGMSLAKLVITQMSAWAAAADLEISQAIEEVHHVHKKDAPSGTALLWKRWILEASGVTKPEVKVTSQRVEDQCGTHEYTLILPQETMSFKHDATSRAVFAEGAVWALDKVLQNKTIPNGKNDFFDLVKEFMKGKS